MCAEPVRLVRPESPAANPDTVRLAQRLLELALAGEIDAFAYIAASPGRSFCGMTETVKNEPERVAGALRVLSFRIDQALDARSRPE